MDQLTVQLEQAEAARQTLTTLQDQAGRVPELRQQIGDRDRLARARSVANSTEQQAWDTVNNVRPALEDWRREFRDWVRQGWTLLQQLRTLESQLVPALDVAVAGASQLVAAGTRPGDFDERVFLGQSSQDQAVDQLLERLGVGDLDPFADVPAGFPQEVADLCLRHSGRVFVPRLGRVFFQRRGGARRG